MASRAGAKALYVVRHGHATTKVSSLEAAARLMVLVGGTDCAPQAFMPEKDGKEDDGDGCTRATLLLKADSTAFKLLGAILHRFPAIDGKATRSFGTALRVPAVRELLA